MSNAKYDAIKNYNLSYLNLLEAAKELEGYVLGLSKNDLFLFLDEENINDFVNEFKQVSVDNSKNNIDSNLYEGVVSFLDRTTGTYFLKDFLEKYNTDSESSDVQMSDFMHIIGDEIGVYSGSGKGNKFISCFVPYRKDDNKSIDYYKSEDIIGTYTNNTSYKDKTGEDGKPVKSADGTNVQEISYEPKKDSEYKRSPFIKSAMEHDRFKCPGLQSIVLRQPNLGILSKSSSHLPVFFNGIPPIEMSRAVPYMDVKIISTSFVKDNKSNKMSFNKYFRFESDNFYDLTDNFVEVDSTTGNINKNYMDVFATPQTFSNADINRSKSKVDIENRKIGKHKSGNEHVLEPIMPLMSLKSMTVSITSAGVGILSSKSAKLSLVLHDRTRLKEIAPLISPSKFATTKIEIEYGWNHPEGGINSKNVFGRYLNGLKDKSVYQVVSSDFNFSDGGEVSVDISLVAYGFRQVETVHIGAGPVAPLNILEPFIEEATKDVIRNLKETTAIESVPEVRQKVKTNARSARSPANSLEWETFTEIISKTKNPKEYINNLSNVLKNENSDDPILNFDSNKLSMISSMYGKIEAIETPSDPDPFVYSLVNGAVISEINKIQEELKGEGQIDNVFDTETIKSFLTVTCRNWEDDLTLAEDHVTLGKVLNTFVGSPMASTCLYDEVQLVFYPLNHQSGGARIHTTASFPIPISKLKKLIDDNIKKSPILNIKRFFNLLEKEIVRDRNLPVYGFSNVKSLNESNNLKNVKTFDHKTLIVYSLLRNESESLQKIGFNESDDIHKLLKQDSRSYNNINSTLEDESFLSKDSSASIYERWGKNKKFVANKENMKDAVNKLYNSYITNVASKVESGINARCAEIYNNDGLYKDIVSDSKFVRPNLAMDFEVIPIIMPDLSSSSQSSEFFAKIKNKIENTKPDLNVNGSGLYDNKSILRIHIYDEEAIKSPEEFSMMTSMIDGNTRKIISDNSDASNNLYDAVSKMSFWETKQLVKREYPTINYGSSGSTIKSISVSSNTSGELANVLMVESYNDLQSGQISANSYDASFEDSTMLPTTISLSMVGMPMISRGSSLFIDFETNTSLDNIYTVKSVTHNISQGTFDTSLDLVPSNMGVIKNFKEDILKTVSSFVTSSELSDE